MMIQPPVCTHISAVLGQSSVRLLADLVSVHLGSTTVVLSVGVVGGAAMLAEEGRLWGRGRQHVIHTFHNIPPLELRHKNIPARERASLLEFTGWTLSSLFGVNSDLQHWRCLRPAYIWAETSSSWSPTPWIYRRITIIVIENLMSGFSKVLHHCFWVATERRQRTWWSWDALPVSDGCLSSRCTGTRRRRCWPSWDSWRHSQSTPVQKPEQTPDEWSLEEQAEKYPTTHVCGGWWRTKYLSRTDLFHSKERDCSLKVLRLEPTWSWVSWPTHSWFIFYTSDRAAETTDCWLGKKGEFRAKCDGAQSQNLSPNLLYCSHEWAFSDVDTHKVYRFQRERHQNSQIFYILLWRLPQCQ